MDSIDYHKLYKLQDAVLKTIFNAEDVFYLTGGTCLSRFYHEKRYSDDLDFFTNDTRKFSRGMRIVKLALETEFNITEEVTSKDFVRLQIDNFLQVDFVNDRVMRYEEPIYLKNGYIIDNCKNILANKLTAVIGRDNAKDIFDIYLIDKYEKYGWKEILVAAHEKADFYDDDLIVRLKTFPVSLLKKIALVDTSFLDNFLQEYPVLIEKIENAMETI